MVGNDIVDLTDPDTDPRALSPRFDARVFNSAERSLLGSEADGGVRQRWRLWSAKEAAYKVARKLDAATVFSPVLFEVEPCGCSEALVRHSRRRFRVRWFEERRVLHAVAVPEGVPVGRLLHGHRPAGTQDPSMAARRLARESMAAELGVASSELEVRRSGRVPELWLCGEPADFDLSLSHHGGWVAFACSLRHGPSAIPKRSGRLGAAA